MKFTSRYQNMKPYTPPGQDLYCSPCRLYEPTYRSSPHIPLEEVMWLAGEEVYSDNLGIRTKEGTLKHGGTLLGRIAGGEILDIELTLVANLSG